MEGTDKQNSCEKDKQERKKDGVEKGDEPEVNVAVKSSLPEIKGQSEQMQKEKNAEGGEQLTSDVQNEYKDVFGPQSDSNDDKAFLFP